MRVSGIVVRVKHLIAWRKKMKTIMWRKGKEKSFSDAEGEFVLNGKGIKLFSLATGRFVFSTCVKLSSLPLRGQLSSTRAF